MGDRPWGADLSSEDLPFAIAYGGGAPGITVANASGGSTSGGSFVMPWAGNLTVAYTGMYSWVQNGHQQAQLHLGASSPGPNSFSQLNQIASNPAAGLRGELPMYASWLNLVKGQVVSFVIYLGVGGGGPSVVLEQWSGTIRAWPA